MAKITYYTSAKQLDDSCKSGFAGRMTTFETCGIDKTQTENKQPIEATTIDLPTTDIQLAEMVAVQSALEHAISLGASSGTRLSVWCDNDTVVSKIHNDMHDRQDDFDAIKDEVVQTIRMHLKRLGRKKGWPIVQTRTNTNSISKEITEAVGFEETKNSEALTAPGYDEPLEIVAKLRERSKMKSQ